MSTIEPLMHDAEDQAADIEVIEEQAVETAPSTPSTTVDETTKTRLNFKNGFNLIAYILNITLVYGVGNAGWLGTPDNGELSRKYQTIVTPASTAFSIWAVIFLAQGAWAVLQLLPRFRAHPMVQDGASYWYMSVAAMQIGWTFAFAYEVIPLSLAFMLLILLSLYGILYSQYNAKSDGSLSEFWILRFPFAVHAGWITAASALNVNVQVVAMEQPAYVQLAVAIVSLAALHAVSVWVLFVISRPNWTIACVLTWAFGWIYHELNINSDRIVDTFSADTIVGVKYAALAVAIIIPSQIVVRLALLIRPYYNPYIQTTRDNFEVLSSMHRSILDATNTLVRAIEEHPFVTPPPPAEKDFGEQIVALYKRLKTARDTGMEASALRYERLIADLEARDEVLTRAQFLNTYFA
ncbi:hypothetical protein ACHAXA_004761 [Cyclostephanos tholiformis]|uniref:Uncharacterized protein n=1 Tax=Cyclostephanos tholiformis TaxID=382380 RepID=A0ABD3REL5_9STRA